MPCIVHSVSLSYKFSGWFLQELVSSKWSTARYHALYNPQCGFELQSQWMVSTGGILGELVSSQWSTARYHALFVQSTVWILVKSSVDGFYRWNIRGVGK